MATLGRSLFLIILPFAVIASVLCLAMFPKRPHIESKDRNNLSATHWLGYPNKRANFILVFALRILYH